MTSSEALLLRECERRIVAGSKTFSFAGRFFSRSERRGAFYLYSWCRFSDDAIDQLEASSESQERLPVVLQELKKLTHQAFQGQESGDPAFIALSRISREKAIPEYYATELLEGMAMDVSRMEYKTENDLLTYCYRVAGTVGLMMSHIMGLSSEDALESAGSLGIGMQLTNIARDVFEDAQMGRVYLPRSWTVMVGIENAPGAILGASPEQIAELRKRLIDLAESFYLRGFKGTRFLSLRSSLTIRAAGLIYREIGRQILRQNSNEWRQRTVVGLGRKVTLAFSAVLGVMLEIPFRWKSPHREIRIQKIWRLSV